MRTLIALFMTSLPVLALTACGIGDEAEAESDAAGLSVAYVSGHLGTESACPAIQPQALRDAALRAVSCPQTGCVPDPCFNGALLVRVKNIAEHEVPVQVVRIELIKADKATQLEIREVASTDRHIVHTLDAGGESTLRILFPAGQTFDGQNETARVRVIFSGEDSVELEIKTPELELVPAVVT